MKKLFYLLFVFCSLSLSAQVQTINSQLKLTNVPAGPVEEFILVTGTDKIVKKIPKSSVISPIPTLLAVTGIGSDTNIHVDLNGGLSVSTPHSSFEVATPDSTLKKLNYYSEGEGIIVPVKEAVELALVPGGFSHIGSSVNDFFEQRANKVNFFSDKLDLISDYIFTGIAQNGKCEVNSTGVILQSEDGIASNLTRLEVNNTSLDLQTNNSIGKAKIKSDLLTSTDQIFQFPNDSGTIALKELTIPIFGTAIGVPISGNLQFETASSGTKKLYTSFSTFGTGLSFDSFSKSRLYAFDDDSGFSSNISVVPNKVNFEYSNPDTTKSGIIYLNDSGFSIQSNPVGDFYSRIKTSNLTADRVIQMPDDTGIIALQGYADAKVSQTITDGVTDKSPSEDAVFDALAAKTSELQKLNEGNGFGYRILGKNSANYGNIGLNGVDLSESTAASSTKGATASSSYAQGYNTTSSGFASHAEGLGGAASAQASHVEGTNGTASGTSSHSEGSNNIASGFASHAGGIENTASSLGEMFVGIYGSTVAGNSGAFVGADRIFSVGNGLNPATRSDAIVILKNGTITAPTFSLAEITTAGNTALITKEYGDSKITQYITNGITATAPSEDVVFDALGLKVNTTDVISVATGGTGATTASDARTNLGLGSLATQSGTFSGTSSGTNTGDNATNTQYSGLVSNATHTGDATGSTALTLATVNSNVGTFGSASTVNTITANGKGLITAVTNNPIAITQSQVTNLVSDLVGKQVAFNNVVVVNNWATDLPAPVAGNITLVDNKTYIFRGLQNISTNTITFGTSNTLIGFDKSSDGIIYTGTAAMFINSNKDCTVGFMALAAVTTGGSVYNFTGSTNKVEIRDVIYNACKSLGTINGIDVLVHSKSLAIGCSGGLTVQGTCNFVNIADALWEANISTMTCLSIPSGTFKQLKISRNEFDIATTQTGISVGTPTVTNAVISDCDFVGAGTYLSGVNQVTTNWQLRINRGTGIINNNVSYQIQTPNVANSNTVTNSTAEVNFTGTGINFTVPAGNLRVGSRIICDAVAIQSSIGTAITFKSKGGSAGTTTFATTPSRASTVGTNLGQTIRIIYTVRTVGASGTCTASITTLFAEAAFADGSLIPSNGTKTIDTTVTNIFRISAQWAVANAGNSVTIEDAEWKILY